MRHAMLFVLGLLILSAAAVAGGDAEARFHEAYVMEVIDGKVAEAAKTYLAIIDDEAAPAALRAESRFRFAVCAALLGRADEARAHLAELLKDPGTPESLRDRAAEYARAVEGIGVGSELTRKLESLVFDLGRADVTPPAGENDPPAVYRDFEIIGPAAIPFLRKLLAHPDLSLRRHAWRLLVRMGADGMVEAWTPEIGLFGGRAAWDFGGWLSKRPQEVPAFEKRLLAAPDNVLLTALSFFPRIEGGLSEEFVRAVAARAGKEALGISWQVQPRERSRTLLVEWSTGEDEPLARGAADFLLRWVPLTPDEAPLPAAVFASTLRRFCARLPDNIQVRSDARLTRIREWASKLPATEALDRLSELLETKRTDYPPDPLRAGVADALALSLDDRLSDPAVPGRYGDLLLAWAATGRFEADRFAKHPGALLLSLPPEEAAAFALRLAGEKNLLSNRTLAQILGFIGDRQDLRPLLAALTAAPPEARAQVFQAFRWPQAGSRGWPADRARALIAIAPAVLAVEDFQIRSQVWSTLPGLLESLPEAEAVKSLTAIVTPFAEGIRRGSDKALNALLNQANVQLPGAAFTALAELLPERRRDLVSSALGRLKVETIPMTSAERDGLWRFSLAHVECVGEDQASILALAPDTFPLEDWVPRMRSLSNFLVAMQKPVEQERVDRAARAMTADPEKVSYRALEFVSRVASAEVQKEIATRLLETAREPVLESVAATLAGMADAAVVEAALGRVLAEESPNLYTVAGLLEKLVRSDPSEKLFPAVRLLLAAGERGFVEMGVMFAQSLGREDLLPDLAKLLDSLDASVREQARSAMASILELKRLREEQKAREAGLGR